MKIPPELLDAMAKVTIWIRKEDYEKWLAIEDLPEWIHEKVNEV